MTNDALTYYQKAISIWCRKRDLHLEIPPTHVYPVSYVIGHAAPRSLIVAQPWVHASAVIQNFVKENPLANISIFDLTLKAGDWCTTAYITLQNGREEMIAIPVVYLQS